MRNSIRHAHRRKNRWCVATGVDRVRRAHGVVFGGQERVERALNAFEESHRSSVEEAGKQSKFLLSTTASFPYFPCRAVF